MDQRGEKVAGIVLAAGASTRMGRLKQLLPVGGEVLIERVLGRVLASHLDIVVLVLGHQAREIEALLMPRFHDPRLRIIENPLYREGISASIAAGIKEVERTHDHAMVFLGDMPCITAAHIDRLMDRYLASRMKIGAMKGPGRPGHPVVFNRDLYGELKGLTGDVGARSLLEKYGDAVCLVEPDPDYDDLDIDTPGDYRMLEGSERAEIRDTTSSL